MNTEIAVQPFSLPPGHLGLVAMPIGICWNISVLRAVQGLRETATFCAY
jgi:hypothetical protein